jgi:hypothetical protein
MRPVPVWVTSPLVRVTSIFHGPLRRSPGNVTRVGAFVSPVPTPLAACFHILPRGEEVERADVFWSPPP